VVRLQFNTKNNLALNQV